MEFEETLKRLFIDREIDFPHRVQKVASHHRPTVPRALRSSSEGQIIHQAS